MSIVLGIIEQITDALNREAFNLDADAREEIKRLGSDYAELHRFTSCCADSTEALDLLFAELPKLEQRNSAIWSRVAEFRTRRRTVEMVLEQFANLDGLALPDKHSDRPLVEGYNGGDRWPAIPEK